MAIDLKNLWINPKLSNIDWFGTYNESTPPSHGIEFLTWLSKKLDITVRQWDYWDIYKFSGSVNSAEGFGTALAQLVPNHALVINTPYFEYNTVGYQRGDVVLKQDNGDLVHILSQSPGIYFPKTINQTELGAVNITYGYATSLNELPTTGDISYNPLTHDSNTITLNLGTDYSTTYNQLFNNEASGTFSVIAAPNNEILPPIAKSWYVNAEASDAIEELITDIAINNASDSFMWEAPDLAAVGSAVNYLVMFK